MNELFLLPIGDVAMPRSYWEDQRPHIKLSSQLAVIKPSKHQFERCQEAVAAAMPKQYDMELFNMLYGDSAMVLPHQTYDLFTREFRNGPDHSKYLGNDSSILWSADDAFKRAKFLHFSDWPLTKPWVESPPGLFEANMPRCFDQTGQEMKGDSKDLCRERSLWIEAYEDFKRRRSDVCGSVVGT